MKQAPIYALDFDGVLCDSAVETAITGWKAATYVWSDMANTIPEETHIEQFRALRPQLETGYEAILFMRLIQQGESVASIQANIANFISELGADTALLKQLFGQTRDQWIQHARDEWIAMNPLFEGVAEKLQNLKGKPWYIVTTKQERFVEQILQASQVELPIDIYGLDRKMSKQAVLSELLERHGNQTIRLIEDRLPTLFGVLDNEQLSTVELRLVDWGYNTEHDRTNARTKGIKVIGLSEFLQK
ncbi:MAG: HAD family hydrolase [Methyloprofundus sp.]|nr:HAD family hydrolase [Methyloprofundus sp.]